MVMARASLYRGSSARSCDRHLCVVNQLCGEALLSAFLLTTKLNANIVHQAAIRAKGVLHLGDMGVRGQNR